MHAARDVADALADVRRPPVSIGFEGLSWFGGDKPRAIVARIKPTAPLIDLQGEHERRLRRIGLAPETRNFTPHVTLARLRSVSPAAVADYLERARRVCRAALRGDALRALFGARLGRGGPYVVEPLIPWLEESGGAVEISRRGFPRR